MESIVFWSLSLVYDPYEHVPISYNHFLTDSGYYRKWWCFNGIYCILLIELGIWPLRACPNFLRPFFDSFWSLLKMMLFQWNLLYFAHWAWYNNFTHMFWYSTFNLVKNARFVPNLLTKLYCVTIMCKFGPLFYDYVGGHIYVNGQIYLNELDCNMISFGGFLAECLPCY